MYSENREGILMDVTTSYFGIRAAKAKIWKTKAGVLKLNWGGTIKSVKILTTDKSNFAVNETVYSEMMLRLWMIFKKQAAFIDISPDYIQWLLSIA